MSRRCSTKLKPTTCGKLQAFANAICLGNLRELAMNTHITLGPILCGAALILGCTANSLAQSVSGSSLEVTSKAESSSDDENDASEPATPAATVASKPNEADAAPKTFDLTFDDLQFDMEKGEDFERSMLTSEINGYNNGLVTLRGYIRPSFTQSGLTKFIFVRDNKECCFGPGAALYDCVLVKLAPGLKTDYTVRPVTIEGKFFLKEYMGPDDKVWSIYRMSETRVK